MFFHKMLEQMEPLPPLMQQVHTTHSHTSKLKSMILRLVAFGASLVFNFLPRSLVLNFLRRSLARNFLRRSHAFILLQLLARPIGDLDSDRVTTSSRMKSIRPILVRKRVHVLAVSHIDVIPRGIVVDPIVDLELNVNFRVSDRSKALCEVDRDAVLIVVAKAGCRGNGCVVCVDKCSVRVHLDIEFVYVDNWGRAWETVSDDEFAKTPPVIDVLGGKWLRQA